MTPALSSGTTGAGGAGGVGVSSVASSGTGGSAAHASSAATVGAGGGSSCSACLGVGCSADAYCGYGDKECGGNDAPGVCTPRPQGCGKNFEPTCGCDGKVYDNPCEAQMAGVDVSDLGGCTAPAGMFGCGAFFCALGTTYCDVVIPSGGEITYTCEALPPCGDPTSCSCVMGSPCECSVTAEGGITVTCDGG